MNEGAVKVLQEYGNVGHFARKLHSAQRGERAFGGQVSSESKGRFADLCEIELLTGEDPAISGSNGAWSRISRPWEQLVEEALDGNRCAACKIELKVLELRQGSNPAANSWGERSRRDENDLFEVPVGCQDFGECIRQIGGRDERETLQVGTADEVDEEVIELWESASNLQVHELHAWAQEQRATV